MTRANSTERIILVSLAVWAIGIAGCANDPTKGYTLQSPHRKGIRTVAVNIFTRAHNLYRRDIEMRLTEAIVKRIELDTPYKVTTKGRADTQLTGTIEGISSRVMSSNPDTSAPRELEMIVTVSMTWTDLRSGDILVNHKRLRAAGLYIPPTPFGEDFFQGSEQAINRIAKRVVEKMETPW